MISDAHSYEGFSLRRFSVVTCTPGRRLVCISLLLVSMLALLAPHACAESNDPADQVCPRFAPGSVILAPPDLSSANGTLEVTFAFQTVVDKQGLTRYCYIANGSTASEAPTLRVNPGDQLIIHFQNELPAATQQQMMHGMKMPAMHTADGSTASGDCPGSGVMTAETTNLHFHGMNVAPACGQDDVVHTMIQPGDTFTYDVQIPTDEPPGLYWYHPHPHGFSEGQVQGGAAGALIVEGIQNVNTSLAGIPQRLFVLRDQLLPDSESNDSNIPAWDISVNYVPVLYPNYTPAVVQTPPNEQEFWRVLDAAADTILNVQYVINSVPQPLQVVAIDGYPIGGGGFGGPQSETETSLLLGPGARAEFVVTTANPGAQGQLISQNWDTGPDGDYDPARPIANIVPQSTMPQASVMRLPSQARAQKVTRFAGLEAETPVAQRTLYFSETLLDPTNPLSPTTFFLTVAGQTPAIYNPSAPPNIVVHQGTVEDWTVQNTAEEDHVFHIHQLHFQVLAINGQPVNDPAIRDTIDLPYWSGTGPYPSATLRMDFRDPSIIGTFVYHCHILEHEDGGMMGTIQVLPAGIGTTTAVSASSTDAIASSNITLTATVTPASAAGPTMLGTIQFAEDGNNIGNAIPVSNSQAALTTTLIGGNHSITATYSGDATYNESISEALAVTVEDFSLAATGATIAHAGQSSTSTVTVNSSPNFTATISFSCALPNSLSEAACFVNPSTISGNGQVTVTLNTTPPHTTVATWIGVPSIKRFGTIGGGFALVLLAITMPWTRFRKWRVPLTLTLAVLALLLFVAGCGSEAKSEPGTPSGTYNLTVTGTSGSGSAQIQHTVTIPVTVQ